MDYIRRRETSLVNGHATKASSVSERLQSIDNAMTWIRGELEDIKESDRSLMEIFKQLEGDVADLNTYVHSWRNSSVSYRDSFASEGRPVSASDLDLSILNDDAQSVTSFESTLTSSKEEVKTSTAPDVDSAHSSTTYSPVLSSQGLTTSAYSTNAHRMSSSVTSSNIAGKRQTSASPQLKSSASMTKISQTHSPNLVTRLQDETSSVASRNSSESIDSGIQFENGSGNSVEAANTTPVGVTTIAESDDTDLGDFASDVLSMLGMRT